MPNQRYAVIDELTGRVINVVLWDGGQWSPPVGTYVVQSDFADRGDLFNPDFAIFSKADGRTSKPVI